ncbi:MAG: aminotransferase class III-fold pyridoxal phosphate-dependent enzyme [Alphaproteobacteria bacterium]|nr:aminotransferase class III-fold pyridoxal phosphate-dependent enzyme [Alphaproteobacteria bacterium]
MNLESAKVQNFIAQYYNLTGTLTPVPSEVEPNFLLTSESTSQKYIVKISTTHQPANLIDAQLCMINHLSQLPFIPKIIRNLQNQTLTTFIEANTIYYLRILRFIEGEFWYQMHPKSMQLYHALGSSLAQIDLKLQDFSHLALHRTYFWDIAQTQLAKDKLHFITDPEIHRIVGYFLLQFNTMVQPQWHKLRQAYIHNDPNDANILVTANNHIAGIIDFGDCVYSALIVNLAVACTYSAIEDPNPLPLIVALVQGYHQVFPLQELELDLLYYLIAARLSISLCQSYYRLAIETNNSHHFISHQTASKFIKNWLKINPLLCAHQLRQACGYKGLIDPLNQEAELQNRHQHVPKNLSLSYNQKLKINRGALQYLYDQQGATYLDCVNNPAHVGHCHPKVVEAIQHQTAILNTNTRYLHDAITHYAHKLCATLPASLNCCFFVNSGSEANDLAIRLSRAYTKQKDMVVVDNAYHGTTVMDIEMSPYKFNGKGGFTKPDYINIAKIPDTYRGDFKQNDPDAGFKYAQEVHHIIKNLQAVGKNPAAFICESLLGVGGQIPLPKNYLKFVYEYVRSAGGVCIADEVQVGFGRVGKTFWGFELQDVIPDIVVMGKPIGNAHPLAAVVVSQAIAETFNNGMEYFNTFGGNPVSMIAGIAVLDVIKQEKLQENALEVGQWLLQELHQIMVEFEIIGNVRGEGLFIGIEFVKDRKTLEPAPQELEWIIENLKNNGILVSSDGPFHNVLKFKPPLVFSKCDAADFIIKFKESLKILEKNRNIH